MEPEPLRYTAREAQRALRIGNTKFWALVKAGRLRIHRDGPRVYLTVEEARRYMSECERQTPEQREQVA